MKHKDFSQNNHDNKISDTKKSESDLYIIKTKKPYTVKDYFPNYSYEYEHKDIEQESKAMIDDLHNFIENNSDLAISQYSSKDEEAIIEGFGRAIALVELYIKTIYIE
ncbi:hypothetical protein [uncultured Anaerococcus sp.]|uniref:hypothetical protein n=1 Tax=uncultured Anaerococcus sp. TaxID=293428 RepID=UPI00288A9B55|nr:hypothetical protein [uncultured Anaerococcus sp.]